MLVHDDKMMKPLQNNSNFSDTKEILLLNWRYTLKKELDW